MTILEDLARQPKTLSNEQREREYNHNGQLSLSDGVFKTMLWEMNVATDIIADCLLEPVLDRDNWITYFRSRNDNR